MKMEIRHAEKAMLRCMRCWVFFPHFYPIVNVVVICICICRNRNIFYLLRWPLGRTTRFHLTCFSPVSLLLALYPLVAKFPHGISSMAWYGRVAVAVAMIAHSVYIQSQFFVSSSRILPRLVFSGGNVNRFGREFLFCLFIRFFVDDADADAVVLGFVWSCCYTIIPKEKILMKRLNMG